MDAPAMWLRAISISGPHLDIKHFISGWSLPTMLPERCFAPEPCFTACLPWGPKHRHPDGVTAAPGGDADSHSSLQPWDPSLNPASTALFPPHQLLSQLQWQVCHIPPGNEPSGDAVE